MPKIYEAGVLLLEPGDPLGLFCLQAGILLAPTVLGRLCDLQDTADIGTGLALDDHLISRFELAAVFS